MMKFMKSAFKPLVIAICIVSIFAAGRLSGRDRYFAQGYVSSYFTHSSICSIMVNPELKKTEYKNFFNDNGRLKIDYKIYDELLKNKIEGEYLNRVNTTRFDPMRETNISLF